MFTLLSLLGGLMFIALGANALMRGTAGLAQLAGVPSFLIGLAIVGFGTSTPQLFTAVQASQNGAVEMALATAIGASIFNIFCTMGVVGLSGGAVRLEKKIWVRGSVALMSLALICAGVVYFFSSQNLPLPRWLGVLAIALMVVYVMAAYVYEKRTTTFHQPPMPLPVLKQTGKLHPAILASLFAAGLFGLVLGANLLVDTATQLSTNRNLSPRFLGLTVLAVGTALPQLVTSVMAYKDRQHALLLHNLIANTIFNLLGIGGLLVSLNSIQLDHGLLFISTMVLAAATVAFAIFTHPAMKRFKRAEAILFLLAYAIFIGYVIQAT